MIWIFQQKINLCMAKLTSKRVHNCVYDLHLHVKGHLPNSLNLPVVSYRVIVLLAIFCIYIYIWCSGERIKIIYTRCFHKLKQLSTLFKSSLSKKKIIKMSSEIFLTQQRLDNMGQLARPILIMAFLFCIVRIY